MNENSQPPKTILFAGHDLKFAKHIIGHFEARPDFRVLVDETKHAGVKDEEASRKLLARADLIFCEWGLGNAVWYSRNKLPHQRLVVRMHRQEYETDYPRQFDYRAIDHVITIAPLWYEKFHEKFDIPREKLKLVYNSVDTAAMNHEKKSESAFHLGIVGIVPKMKRFDLALDLLESLHRKDNRYKLHVKGKLPHEFPWMLTEARAMEMKYYDECYARIRNSSWGKNVFFDPQGNDMPEWFSKIAFLLSPSDFEGSHHSIAESMAGGCLPVIRNWEGADLIYPKRYVHARIEDMAETILRGTDAATLRANRNYARKHFDKNVVCGQIETLLLEGRTNYPEPAGDRKATVRSIGIYAPINLNYIDGSSIWLQNLIRASASQDNHSVRVLMRADVKRGILTDSLLELGNIDLITPTRLLQDGVIAKAVSPLPDKDLAPALADMFSRYSLDYAILRGLGYFKTLITDETFRSKLCIYPMEMTRNWFRSASFEDIESYRDVFEFCFAIVMQTEEMRDYFLRYYPETKNKIAMLPPMVFKFETASWQPADRLRLVYAGKFSGEWNTLSILSSVRKAFELGAAIEITCFGDKIHNDPKHPEFMPEMQAILESGHPILWKKAVPHEEVLASLGAYDLGIGWRHPSLNQSLEISTKLLEYCKAGIPVVVNPTTMHRRLLSDAYPFFADTEQDFLRLLSTVTTTAPEYRRAREICRQAGLEHDSEKHLSRFFADIGHAFSRGGANRSHNTGYRKAR